MKKIFIVFTLLCVGVCVWADGKYTVSYSVDSEYDHRRIATIKESTTGEDLSTCVSAINSYAPYTVLKVVVNGDVTGGKEALEGLTAQTIDLSSATGLNPDGSTIFNNIFVMQLILPNGWSKAYVNKFSSGCTNLDAAASIKAVTETQSKWYYKDASAKEIEWTGELASESGNTGTANIDYDVNLKEASSTFVYADDNSKQYVGSVFNISGQSGMEDGYYGVKENTTIVNLEARDKYVVSGNSQEAFTGWVAEDGSSYYGNKSDKSNAISLENTTDIHYTYYNDGKKYAYDGHAYKNADGTYYGYVGGNNYQVKKQTSAYTYTISENNVDNTYIYEGEICDKGTYLTGVVGGQSCTLFTSTGYVNKDNGTAYNGDYFCTVGNSLLGAFNFGSKTEITGLQPIDGYSFYLYNQGYFFQGNETGISEINGIKYYNLYGTNRQLYKTTVYKQGNNIYQGFVWTSSKEPGKYYNINGWTGEITEQESLMYYDEVQGKNISYTGDVYGTNTGYIEGTGTPVYPKYAGDVSYYSNSDGKKVVVNSANISIDNYYNVNGTQCTLTAVPEGTTTYYYNGQINGQSAKVVYDGYFYNKHVNIGMVDETLATAIALPNTATELSKETSYYVVGPNVTTPYEFPTTGIKSYDNKYGVQYTSTMVRVIPQFTYTYDTKYEPISTDIAYNNGEIYNTVQTTGNITQTIDLTKKDIEVPTGKYGLTAYIRTAGTLAKTIQHITELANGGYSINNKQSVYSWLWWCDENYGGYNYKSTDLTSLTLSGNLLALDINTFSRTSNIDDAGHFSATFEDSNGFIIATYTGSRQDYTLFGAQISYLDLSDANFAEPNDMCISNLLQASYLKTVLLPTSMNTICHYCLYNCQKVTKLNIPCNYLYIREGAFFLSGIERFTTTSYDGSEVDGYYAGDEIDYGDHTWTLSSTLLEIGTKAFQTTKDSDPGISDLYVLSKTAPKCEMDAFSPKMYFAEGGHTQPQKTVERINYWNGTYYCTVLHFPEGIAKAEQEKYTDLTRVYDLYDEIGETNGNGDVYVWPTQCQYKRAYLQAKSGYTWNAWKQYDTDGTTTYVPFELGSSASTSDINTAVDNAGAWNDKSCTFLADYIGWHQFALVDSAHTPCQTPGSGSITYADFGKYKYNDWYTICVPFNLTRAQLKDIFGHDDKYPEVRTLEYVTRDTKNAYIYLHTSKDLLNWQYYHKDEEGDPDVGGIVVENINGTIDAVCNEYVSKDDNDIIIEADKPYFIKPNLPLKEGGEYLEADIKVNASGKRPVQIIPTEAKFEDKIHRPIYNIHVTALNADRTKFLDYADNECDELPDTASAYRYFFTGSYKANTMIPLYCYFLGTNEKGLAALYRNIWDDMPWTENTCIIGAVCGYDLTKTAICHKGGNRSLPKEANYYVYLSARNDYKYQSSNSQAKTMRYGFTWDDEETGDVVTGIAVPNADGSFKMVPTKGNIYNLNGQYVGSSTENLSKGIYIISGKKIVIK